MATKRVDFKLSVCRQPLTALLWLLCACLCMSACNKRKEATQSCNLHAECGTHQICKAGACIAWTCSTDAQCSGVLRCVEGLCRDVECLDDIECTGARFCHEESCVWPCELIDECECISASDCGSDFCAGTMACVVGQCRTMGNPCGLIGASCNENINACKSVLDVACASDSDCEDDAFCTGTEKCIDDVCYSTGSPCSYDEPYCDEAGGACTGVSCDADNECDNETFCDGAEKCVEGLCGRSDVYACSEDTPFCDPNLDLCVCFPGSADCATCYDANDCAAGEACNDAGVCFDPCEDKVCGDDGFDGSCGDCPGGETCIDGACECVAECTGRVCGDDGCDGSCGECDTVSAEECVEGACICVPACDGKVCGDDGCGGVCGACSTIYACGDVGQCLCEPELASDACASGYFADGAYLHFSAHDDWSFFLDNFTFESWIYFPVDWSTAAMIFYQSDADGREHRLQSWRCDTNNLCFDYSLSVTTSGVKDYAFTCAGEATHSTWHHLALERVQDDMALYVNGVPLSCSGNNPDASNDFGDLSTLQNSIAAEFLVGSDGEDATHALKAYLDDLRLVKGSAVYGEAFVPTEEPLRANEDTALLLHFDAPESAPGIVDVSAKNHALQIEGDVVNASAYTPFPCANTGQASAFFSHFNTQTSTALYGASSNTQGPHLVVNVADGEETELVFNGTDFTFEWHVRFATFDYTDNPNSPEKILLWSNTLGEVDLVFEFSVSRAGLVMDYVNAIRGEIAFAQNLIVERWYHMALVYDTINALYTFYIDGESQGSIDEGLNTQGISVSMRYTGTQDSQSPKTIGGGAGGASGWRNNLSGYLDEFHVAKTQRYTANFTPPAYDFVADEHTVLLLRMDGDNAGVTFSDSSATEHLLSVQGGVTTSTQYDAVGPNQCAFLE
jgi:hypothetical protein